MLRPMPILGRLRVLLVENPGLMRDSLAALLRTEPGIEVLGAIANSVQAVRLSTAASPDVAIMDFAPVSGVSTVAALHGRWPSTQVLVLTSSDDPRLIDTALRAGAAGYLLRSDTRAEFMTAVRKVSQGDRYVSRSMRERVASLSGTSDVPFAASEGLSLLTDREREVMQCVASGLRTREIAERLSLSHKTVEKHRSNLMRKLGLRSAAAVAAFAMAKRYGRA